MDIETHLKSTFKSNYNWKPASKEKIEFFRELTKEQLLIKEQQISTKIDMLPWRTKPTEAAEAESPPRGVDQSTPRRQTQSVRMCSCGEAGPSFILSTR